MRSVYRHGAAMTIQTRPAPRKDNNNVIKKP